MFSCWKHVSADAFLLEGITVKQNARPGVWSKKKNQNKTKETSENKVDS